MVPPRFLVTLLSMRGRALLAITAAVALAAPASAGAVTSATAKKVVRYSLTQDFAAFTESKPKITVKCQPGYIAKCRATFRGDRVKLRLRARVAYLKTTDQYKVTYNDLHAG